MYGRTISWPNSLEGSTISLSNSLLTTPGQNLTAGSTCGTLKNLKEEVTKDFVHDVSCPAGASGRYVQIRKAGQDLTIIEVEVYIATAGPILEASIILIII